MEHELKDWRGHTITVGTPVAYPVTSGSSPGIKEGIVLEIGDGYVKVRPGATASRWVSRNYTDKPRTLRGNTVKNLVVLPRTNHEAPHEAPLGTHCASCDGHSCPEVG